MRNMQTRIKQHNSRVTKKEKPCTTTCDFHNKFEYPLGNKWFADKIVYQAEVITEKNNHSTLFTWVLVKHHLKKFIGTIKHPLITSYIGKA